jgi:ABC-type transporter Mla subunit MlaD
MCVTDERQVVAQLERVRQEHSRQVEHVTQKMETVVQTLGQREHTVDTALARLHSATDSVTQQADALRTSQDAVQATLTAALHR